MGHFWNAAVYKTKLVLELVRLLLRTALSLQILIPAYTPGKGQGPVLGELMAAAAGSAAFWKSGRAPHPKNAASLALNF